MKHIVQKAIKLLNGKSSKKDVISVKGNKMRECLDCNKDISNLSWQAKRCFECSHIHQLNIMKEYRNKNKDKLKEYQKSYYKKPENKRK